MNRICLFLFSFLVNAGLPFSGNTQNIGIGTDVPSQKLEINGAIKIAGTTTANPGAIRWNETKSDFEGYNGIAWVSLTGGKGKWGDQTSCATENNATQYTLLGGAYPGTELGYAIAAEGDWMVAGAYRDGVPGDPTQWAAGSIHLFRHYLTGWNIVADQYDPDAKTNDFFGKSVGLSATHMIVGAYNADLPPLLTDIGKAFIYTYDANGSALQATLSANDAQNSDYFGSAVSIHGDIAAVSAFGNNVGGIANVGSVYIFTRSGTTWTQTANISPPDATANDGFGGAMSLWGDYMAASCMSKTVNGFYSAGKVYVYKKSGATWSLIAQLISPTPTNVEYFGYSVYIRDNVLVIGAPHSTGIGDDGPGTVYVYQINNNSVDYQATLTASDGIPSDGLGQSVYYHNGVILAGAPRAAIGSNLWQGKSYIFRLNGGAWQEEAILKSSLDEASMFFGTSTALTNSFAIIGSPLADMPNHVDNGQVMFFKRN